LNASTLLGYTYWSSEDFSTVADWHGAGCWGRTLNQNWVRGNITSTTAWSLIWSVYDSLAYFGNGLMYAYWPWSGYYTVNPSIWTSAHTCQFSSPGWVYVPVGSGSGLLEGNGSFVTLRSSDASEFSVVVETLQGDCLRCAGGPTAALQTLLFVLKSLPPHVTMLHVWHTNESVQFERLPDIALNGSLFTLQVEADSIYTVSSLLGQSKCSHTAGPIGTFPFPYSDDFDSYPVDSYPRYFSDQNGAFLISVDNTSANRALRQETPQPPGNDGWYLNTTDPISLIGDTNATDYTASCDVYNDAPATQVTQSYVQLCGRVQSNQTLWTFHNKDFAPGYCIRMGATGAWALTALNTTLSSGVLRNYVPSNALTLTIRLNDASIVVSANGTLISTVIDHRFGFGQVAIGCGWHYARFDRFSMN